MMIVVANLRLSGFFRVITHWIAAYVRRPIALLGMVIFSSGVLSAFLINDTICLVMSPLVLELVTQLKRNPIPYLLAIATASNIGSVATVTGNPQNIIIGSLSGIPYGDFAAALVPVAVIGLMITYVFIALSYRTEFFTRELRPMSALRSPASTSTIQQSWPASRPCCITSLATFRPCFSSSHSFRIYRIRNALGL